MFSFCEFSTGYHYLNAKFFEMLKCPWGLSDHKGLQFTS